MKGFMKFGTAVGILLFDGILGSLIWHWLEAFNDIQNVRIAILIEALIVVVFLESIGLCHLLEHPDDKYINPLVKLFYGSIALALVPMLIPPSLNKDNPPVPRAYASSSNNIDGTRTNHVR